MNCAAVDVALDNVKTYQDDITPIGPFIKEKQQSKAFTTAPTIKHNFGTNEHTYEYLINEMLYQNVSTTSNIQFYISGVLNGYNIGYEAAKKDFASEIEETSGMQSDELLTEMLRNIDTKLDSLDSKIDSKADSLDGKSERRFNVLLQKSDKLDDKIADIDKRLVALEAKEKYFWKNKQFWISILVAALTAFLSALFQGKIHF